MRAFALGFSACVAVACGDTGQPLVRHPVFAVGTAARTTRVGDWDVTLSVARVGFGPVNFCASRAASPELCSEPLAEWAATATIDGLSETPQRLGTVNGFAGTVQSLGFAYAIPWLTTEDAPRPKSGAPGGHSAHLEGSARRSKDGFVLAFVADVDVRPVVRAQPAVSLSGLSQILAADTQRLDVRFDPSAWVGQVDFDALAAGGPTATVVAKSQGWDALVVGMTALAPPTFVWTK